MGAAEEAEALESELELALEPERAAVVNDENAVVVEDVEAADDDESVAEAAADSLDVDAGTSYHHRWSEAAAVVAAVEMVT